jgi:oligopeptide/dipeptide ABC transporter ATP-binding protein
LFGKREFKAVQNVNFKLRKGHTLGVVGESGSGKTTMGLTLLRLHEATGGEVLFDGRNLLKLSDKDRQLMRRRIQIVFQNPYASLNPRFTIGQTLLEPMVIHAIGKNTAEREQRARALLEKVGLDGRAFGKYPHEFSGGQRQRVAIARCLTLNPEVLVLDEAVSALDVSVQAQVINLLMDLQDELGLSYLFIAHDLAVVEHISHRVAVMYLGKIVEITDKRTLFANPQHPYTEALLSAVPLPDPKAARKRIILAGDVPSPVNPPAGCRFHTRCPVAVERCRVEVPAMLRTAPGHLVACHLREGEPAETA